MKLFPAISLISSLVLICACANTGTPGGGPKDETPPRLIKSEPKENQVNYKKKKIEIFFDELISLEKVSEKVIVSPPQKSQPVIKTISNKIVVVFQDTLKDSTTYTVDFTDAIVDYNEKNKFGDYAFSFSTGPFVDSLRIAGILIDASNLNPVSGVFVGVNDVLHDSAFNTQALTRISKTTQTGFFSVKGLPSRSFRVYALGDKNRDYRFDQPGESIAFYDSIVMPWTEVCQKPDTIWKDTVTVDTIIMKDITCYKPDDLILRYFAEDFGRQYLAKRERPSREKLVLTFGYKSDTVPKLTLLNSASAFPAACGGVSEQNTGFLFGIGDSSRLAARSFNQHVETWFLPEINPTKDTLTYWINDTAVSNLDTLLIKLDYLKTDSTNQLAPVTDTLKLILRTAKPKARQQGSKKNTDNEKPKPEPVTHLMATISLPSTLDINATPVIVWETPIRDMTDNPWHLYRKKDTIWYKMPFSIEKDSVFLRKFLLKAKWDFGTEYRLDLDSGLVTGIYGVTNDKFSKTFKIREEEEYSRLILTVSGIQSPAFVELLNKSDNVIRMEPLVKGIADFKFLRPGTYYLRAIEDINGNLKWDTGSYTDKRQPEQVFYRPDPVTLRSNWDIEEFWDVTKVPLLEQKPKALIKKPGDQTGGRK